MARLLDTHCHLDQYPDPDEIISLSENDDVMVVAMTEAPSAFERLRRRFHDRNHIRYALGVHPLVAAKLPPLEWQLFDRYMAETTYIGEVGLDFSRRGASTRIQQEQAFRRVLTTVAGRGKILSIHSRRAEGAVLELLEEYRSGSTIFHWYSGSLGTLDQIIESGHYCSINPAMIHSTKGMKIIGRVPPSRTLVETDGPYVRINNRPATPADTKMVYHYLAAVWQWSLPAVIEQVYSNFRTLLRIQKRAAIIP